MIGILKSRLQRAAALVVSSGDEAGAYCASAASGGPGGLGQRRGVLAHWAKVMAAGGADLVARRWISAAV